MKRHMKMSLVLVTLLLTLGILLTGCGTEELQTQIDDNATKADSSIKDAATEAKKNLDDAVAELKALIAAGDKADAEALADAITAVNSAIDAAEKAAEDGDADLQKAIDDAEAAIEAAKNAWNEATDAIVAALAEIQKMEGEFASVKANYDDDKVDVIENALDVAWVKVVRALDADAVKAAMDELKEIFDITPTVTGEIYNLLNKILEGGVVCTPEEADDGADLTRVKTLIYGDAVTGYVGIKAGDNATLKAELNAYGESAIDLEAEYVKCQAMYDAEVAKLEGAVIKAEMDEINATLMTADTDVNTVYNKYVAWEAVDGNDATDVEGFEATVDTYKNNMLRVAELVEAKALATALNTRIENFADSVEEYASTKANYETKLALAADITKWVETYFYAPYDAEIEDNSVNYQMLKIAEFEAACEAFDTAMGDAMTAAADFIIAVKNVGDINLLSWDEIELAQSFYLAWIDAEGVDDLSFMFNMDETPEDYYKTLITYMGEFNALQAKANTDYVAAKATADTVNANTITIYSTELGDLLKWYEDYTFNAENEAVFENTTFAGVTGFSDEALAAFGDVADGYKLSADLVVTADDYKALTDLKAVQDELIANKKAAADALEEQIDAIGFVYIDADDAKNTVERAVVAAREAYNAWMAGSSDPDEDGVFQDTVMNGCTVFVVENYATLTAAEDKIVSLKAQAKAIKDNIALLDFTDADMDLATLPSDFDPVDYGAFVDYIQGLYDAFIHETTGNNGNRGMISEEELADLAAADLIVTKYNALVTIKAKYDAKVVEVDANAELEAPAKATIKEDLATVYSANKALVEKATLVEDIADIVNRVDMEFDAVINGKVLD